MSAHERFGAVELCGFGQEATDRKNEIPMALRSSIAVRYAEDNNVAIYVAGPTLDLFHRRKLRLAPLPNTGYYV